MGIFKRNSVSKFIYTKPKILRGEDNISLTTTREDYEGELTMEIL